MFLIKAVRINNGALSYGTLDADVRMMKATQYDLHTRILQSINILEIILTTLIKIWSTTIVECGDHINQPAWISRANFKTQNLKL